MFEFDETVDQSAKIKVIGVGGGGCNAINRMVEAHVTGVEFIAANTDAQSLAKSNATIKVQLGAKLTKGLGAGCKPETGRSAAEEDKARIKELLEGSDMVFVATGLGGGTGTGAAPVIAEIARNCNPRPLVVGVVTRPFKMEGAKRATVCEEGIKEMKKNVDSLIVIPNDRLLGFSGKKGVSILDAFKPADDVLLQAVQSISDLITTTGFINVDFADVQTIMGERGMAIMGVGYAEGNNRAREAALQAISSPLLDDIDISGAKGVLVNVCGSSSMTLEDYYEVSEVITERADGNAHVKIGIVTDESLGETIKVTAIATGFGELFDVVEEPQRPSLSTIGSRPLRPATSGSDPYAVNPAIRNGGSFVDRPARHPRAATPDPESKEFDIPAFLRKQVD